ncbi:lipid-binding protein [Sporocytophaga myxococcoides]|uniref:Lipid-binding protein n=1 Tax=Sporocytophaga myxococcoides TaxID=153721 RepID=A0A098LCG2_9BACT|nr:YceI family protein [Sporocytophaga myxococcoides]GAL84686.1 lipid-binding protein [Sporocytophaga myxococcoides]
MMKQSHLKLLFIFSLVLLFSCETKKQESGTSDTTATATGGNAVSQEGEAVYKVDTANSSIKWTGKKVTGKHNGSIKIQSGELKVVNNVITGGTITIDMKSIKNEDLTDKESNQKLIGHLKSPDFFDVEKHPTATFEIQRLDAGKAEKEEVVTGKLTLKGKTDEISVPVKINHQGNELTAKGTTVIDRTKWDIRYGSGKFFENLGDKAIYDEVDIEFDLKATK